MKVSEAYKRIMQSQCNKNAGASQDTTSNDGRIILMQSLLEAKDQIISLQDLLAVKTAECVSLERERNALALRVQALERGAVQVCSRCGCDMEASLD